MRKYFKLILLLLTFALAFSSLPISAEEGERDAGALAKATYDSILESAVERSGSATVDEWIGKELCGSIGKGGEWYIFTLAQVGGYDLSACESAMLEYLDSHSVGAATSKQKFALCLAALGSTDSYIYRTLEETIGQLGLMSYVYGLHLLNNGYTSSAISTDSVIDKLLSFQISDGGWAVNSTTVSDVDVSAMVLQALALHKDKPAVASAIDRALEFLSSAQLEDGDYKSYGVPNPQSVAQVMVALSSLSIDFSSDQRFIKNGNDLLDGLVKYSTEDGGFASKEGGESNYTSTVQAFYALAAYMRYLDGNAPLYLLDNCNVEGMQTDVAEDISESETATEKTPSKDKLPTYKIVCFIVIAALTVALCILLLALGKRNFKNFLALLVAAALCSVFILLTNFSTPDDYYGEEIVKDNPIGSVTISIKCEKLVGQLDGEQYSDGVILDSVSMTLGEGDSVYDILRDAAKKYRLQIENNGTEDRAYIAAIEHIYEFEYGDLSGWTYLVNGKTVSVGCSEYKLADGDVIEWVYTLELGKDL